MSVRDRLSVRSLYDADLTYDGISGVMCKDSSLVGSVHYRKASDFYRIRVSFRLGDMRIFPSLRSGKLINAVQGFLKYFRMPCPGEIFKSPSIYNRPFTN